MAVLGISQIDFQRKTFDSFLEDAKRIARFCPSDMLIWGRNPEVYTSDRFKSIEDQYLRSCHIQGKDEYSEVSLKWAISLAQKIHIFHEIKDEDLELFKKVAKVFKNLRFCYQTKLIELTQVNRNRENVKVVLIQNAMVNYLQANQVILRIIYKIELDKKSYASLMEGRKQSAPIEIDDQKALLSRRREGDEHKPDKSESEQLPGQLKPMSELGLDDYDDNDLPPSTPDPEAFSLEL